VTLCGWRVCLCSMGCEPRSASIARANAAALRTRAPATSGANEQGGRVAAAAIELQQKCQEAFHTWSNR
jgi:hypothetical protein